MIWNGGLRPGSETAVAHRSTGDTVVVAVLEGGLFSTRGMVEDCNDRDRLTEAELVVLLRGCDPHPLWEVENFPFVADGPRRPSGSPAIMEQDGVKSPLRLPVQTPDDADDRREVPLVF
ncbi:hypothetical protein ACLBYF_04300 [Methylobacterium brachiatum]